MVTVHAWDYIYRSFSRPASTYKILKRLTEILIRDVALTVLAGCVNPSVNPFGIAFQEHQLADSQFHIHTMTAKTLTYNA